LVTDGYLEGSDDDHKLTEKGTGIGAEMKKGRYGEYFIWPESFNL